MADGCNGHEVATPGALAALDPEAVLCAGVVDVDTRAAGISERLQ